MIKYLAKRMGRSLITLLFILTLVFVLLRLMPIEGYFDNFDKLTEEQIQVGLEGMGLTDPMPVQLVHFFEDLLHGDLGVSRRYRSNVAVTEILASKIPISVQLGSMSILLSLLCGLPMGILMTKNKGKMFDKIGTLFIVFIQAVPAMVYFLFIQLYGTTLLNVPLLFDASNPICWILPVFSMSLGNTAYYGMWLRRYMVDESTKDYVKLAKAKGVSEGQIMVKHIFKNAFVPLIQYLPTSFLNTVIGSIYIESLYSVPGMGGLLVDVIKKNDNNMVQAIVLLYAIVGVIGLLLGDILMTAVDPRISLSKKGGGR
ncbi:MAG: binding-protein-dependent transport system inner rane component [Lachnospiraceae bacterium]|jgi:ABC-type dipeptide/oligopeptide/nickel transport system permease component|nr:binding-protein-dependent transport system inner rane component [Lachnospiraceae bacterium]